MRRVVWTIVFSACLSPLAWLAVSAFSDDLGANPIEACNRFLGDWALRFLLITLAVTPLREITGRAEFMRWRRMLGLFAFTYAALHVTSYVGLDQFFDWREIWADLRHRNFITVGMIGLVLLVPLAATSTKGMIRRLGGPRWKKLHRLVYPSAVLAVVHFYMMVKADVREPLIYGAVLALLLGYRIVARVWRKRRRIRTAS